MKAASELCSTAGNKPELAWSIREWLGMAHSCQGVVGSMKGRKSVPEGEEDASTQPACRTVVNMVLETSQQETYRDSPRAWSLSQPHPWQRPSEWGTCPEESQGEVIRWVRKGQWPRGTSVWAQSVIVCDWWASFFLGIGSERQMKWFPPPLTSGGLTSEGSGRETSWE